MSAPTDYLLDRRRLRRKLSWWRLIAIAAATLAAVVIVARLSGADSTDKLTPHIARLSLQGLIIGGYVLYEKFGASVDLHTNGVSLLTDKFDHRAVATWESALQELVDRGLLVARGDRGEVYEITRKGYEAAASQSRTEGLPSGS